MKVTDLAPLSAGAAENDINYYLLNDHANNLTYFVYKYRNTRGRLQCAINNNMLATIHCSDQVFKLSKLLVLKKANLAQEIHADFFTGYILFLPEIRKNH